MERLNEAEDRKREIRNMWRNNAEGDKSAASLVRGSKRLIMYGGKEFVLTPTEKALAEIYVRNMTSIKNTMKEVREKNLGIKESTVRQMISGKNKYKAMGMYIKALQKTQEKVIEKEIGYTASKSFKEFCKVQQIALKQKKFVINKKTGEVKYVKGNPDLTSYIKAEENKGKLFGLYKDAEDSGTKTVMNIVVNGNPTIGMQKIKNKENVVEAEVIE